VVSVDFEAEGLLEGVQEGRTREARLELLRTLSAEGFSLDAFARRGSVVASREVRDAAGDGYSWSPIGRRRFKGVSGDVEVFRVRPAG
jgi:hypothetical protein